MVLECRRLGEGLFAVVTLVRMHPGVDAPVHYEPARAGERFLADFALDPLARVQARVDGEGARVNERFVAVFALEGPLARVPTPVDDEVRRARKHFRAKLALVRPILAVLAQVLLQVVGGFVQLIADVAFVLGGRTGGRAGYHVHRSFAGGVGLYGETDARQYSAGAARRSAHPIGRWCGATG